MVSTLNHGIITQSNFHWITQLEALKLLMFKYLCDITYMNVWILKKYPPTLMKIMPINNFKFYPGCRIKGRQQFVCNFYSAIPVDCILGNGVSSKKSAHKTYICFKNWNCGILKKTVNSQTKHTPPMLTFGILVMPLPLQNPAHLRHSPWPFHTLASTPWYKECRVSLQLSPLFSKDRICPPSGPFGWLVLIHCPPTPT